MKTTYVIDLQKNQVLAGENFLITNFEVAEDKTGKEYGKITLSDKTGTIEGKIWSDKLAKINPEILKPGNIVAIGGKVDEFKGNTQLTITNVEASDEKNLGEYLETSAFDPEEMMKELIEIIESIESKKLKTVLLNIINDKEINKRLKIWPASTAIHHEFRSGLLQHILEMLAIANGMDKFYPNVNFDILKAGIILHDLGKLYEIDGTNLSRPYTKIGNLLGHIYIGARLFEEKGGKDLPEDLRLHITHLILSHHGKQEYGAPVVPATTEALMLYHIDNVSAKPRTADSFISKLRDDVPFSKRVMWLENAQLWKFRMPEDEDDNPLESNINPSDLADLDSDEQMELV